MRGKRELVPLLLAAGADRDVVDKAGKRPAEYSRNRAITQAFGESGERR